MSNSDQCVDVDADDCKVVSEPYQSRIIGRDEEIGFLSIALQNQMEGNGSSIIITGEAGIGKTRLIEEFQSMTCENGIKTLVSSADADSVIPFHLFSSLLKNELDRPLFHEEEYISFTKVFAVNGGGLLIGESSSDDKDLDSDIFAGMLSAVQNFVRDSFDPSRTGDKAKGLGRLEYGDMKILIEHGEHLFLTAVTQGVEHPDMKGVLKRTLQELERDHGSLIDSWTGKIDDMAPVEEATKIMADTKFLVRRDMEGVNLVNERYRISNFILDHLVELASSEPLVIVLEDLQWADEPSLFAFEYIARNVIDKNILLVGTNRPPATKESGLKSCLKSLSGEGTTLLELDKMDDLSLKDLLDILCSPNSFKSGFVNKVVEQCGGNPFFLIEVIRQMKDDGSIGFIEEEYQLLNEEVALPSSVEEVVINKLMNLEPDSLSLSEYASCIGRVFPRSVIQAFKNVEDPDHSFEKLRLARVIKKCGDNGEFMHGIIQDVVYNSMGDIRKSIYHKSLGEYYEDTYLDRMDEVAYDLARHFSHTREYHKTFRYSFRAGDRAANAFAPEQALLFYQQAESISHQVPDLSPEDLRDLIKGMGDVQSLLGNYDEALEKYQKLFEVETGNLEKATIWERISDVYTRKAEYDNAREAGEKGLALVGSGESRVKALLYNSMGRIELRQSDFDSAEEYFIKCLAIAKEQSDKSLIGMAEMLLGVIGHQRGQYMKALPHYIRSLELEEEMENMMGIASVLNNMGLLHDSIGNLDKALECHSRSLEIKRKAGAKYSIGGSLINIGLVHFSRGELDLAEEYYRQSLVIKQDLGDKYGLSLIYNYLGTVYHYKGDYDTSMDYYIKVREMVDSTKDKFQLAEIFLLEGALNLTFEDPEKAKGLLEESLIIAEEIKIYHIMVSTLYLLSDCWLRQGDIDRAEEYVKKADALNQENFGEKHHDLQFHTLGNIHTAKEEWELANDMFEKGIKYLDGMGMKKELALLLYDHGTMLSKIGETKRAREQLEKTQSMFKDMGMKLWAKKTEDSLNEMTG